MRGVALQSRTYTYLERVQQIAEAESALKVEKLERDMPKFLRAQRNYIKEFEKAEKDGIASIQVDGYFVDYPIVVKAQRALNTIDLLKSLGKA